MNTKKGIQWTLGKNGLPILAVIDGTKIGSINFSRSAREKLNTKNIINYTHKYMCSGDIIVLQNSNIAIGVANIGGAYRGFVFNNVIELRNALVNAGVINFTQAHTGVTVSLCN